ACLVRSEAGSRRCVAGAGVLANPGGAFQALEVVDLLLFLLFHLLEQYVHGVIQQGFVMNILIADDALVVDHKNRRPGSDAPLLVDRTARSSIDPRTPGYFLLDQALPKLGTVFITVDTEQSKRLALHLSYERPLVGVHRPAGASPMPPEVEDHHLAPVVAELEALAVDILAFDFGRFLAQNRPRSKIPGR